METNHTTWHENERKMFVWFIVVYCYLGQVEPNKIVFNLSIQSEAEWNEISTIFFNKDLMLLKFQARSI